MNTLLPPRSEASAGSIAIDGPAGAGKTTVARIVASRLGHLYVDTGAMYRAITLKILRLGSPLVPDTLRDLLRCTDVRLSIPRGGSQSTVYLDGDDVTREIRSVWVNRWVSAVSAMPEVRRQMQRSQREMAACDNVVMEGRDIGTVVMPDAGTKVFLTAARRERAFRRTRELRGIGIRTSALQQYIQLGRRDRLDSSRENSPLRPAWDATVIDSTLISPAEVAECIIALYRARQGRG